MVAVRRLYVFILAGVGLGMAVAGAASLGTEAIQIALGVTPFGASSRGLLAGAAAALLVGLPVWILHWTAAQRLARRESSERASALRRLYLYVAQGSLLIAFTIGANRLIELLLTPIALGVAFDAPGLVVSAGNRS